MATKYSKRAKPELIEPLPHFCGVEATQEVIGGRWKATIIFLLSAGNYRFLALKRAIPDVSLKVFTAQLRALELHGLVHRHETGTKSREVEYSLTPLGQSCIPVLEVLETWGLQHQDQLEKALLVKNPTMSEDDSN